MDDREGESPLPTEPRLGRMFHSSATGRRLNKLFLTRSVFVKRFTREMTLREVPAARKAQVAGSYAEMITVLQFRDERDADTV